jgi:hypothetical protein
MRPLLMISVPVVLVATALAAVVAFQPAPRGAHAAVSNLPAGMPGHFSFGIMDSPGGQTYLNGMRSTNGTTWDFRYQYLAGGANTGHGWSTWNTPAGEFAAYYMRDSGDNGYIPAFVYYEMLQSNGPSGNGEGGTDLAHLGSTSTMNAYYADWALLMQKIGAYGKPALVIVEPDLWGFIEQTVTESGNSAANVPASVASSGYADAQGFPNTAQGYAWALLHMRDKYAKNAILALHASTWGTKIDLASNTSAGLDAVGIGAQTAQFLNTAGLAGNPSGVSSFDLVSNDIADHDSGQSGNWWDKNNVTFPNFTRYLQYSGALSNGTGRRLVMWQVPAGNQHFDTENNSPGHTQDNKAEYILGHIADFANAGIAGVLFGPGNSGTNANDARNDGVTNAAPISTYECNQCNNHTSAYADDDGGYLRISLGQYYKGGGYSLGGGQPAPAPTTAPTTPPQSAPTPMATQSGPGTGNCVGAPKITFGAGSVSPATVTAGASVQLAATLTASCTTTAIVDFEVYNASGAKVYQTFLDKQSLTGQAQMFAATWNVPAGQAAGTYTLKVGVFAPGWSATYGWNNGMATFTVQPAVARCTGAPTITFNSGSASPTAVMRGGTERIGITLTASCATGGLVDLEVYNASGAKVWQNFQDNVSLTGQHQAFSASWAVPAGQATGTYTLKVGVFAPGWTGFYAWNNGAATFTVA